MRSVIFTFTSICLFFATGAIARPQDGTVDSLVFGVRAYHRVAKDKVVADSVLCWPNWCTFRTKAGNDGRIGFFFSDDVIAEIEIERGGNRIRHLAVLKSGRITNFDSHFPASAPITAEEHRVLDREIDRLHCLASPNECCGRR